MVFDDRGNPKVSATRQIRVDDMVQMSVDSAGWIPKYRSLSASSFAVWNCCIPRGPRLPGIMGFQVLEEPLDGRYTHPQTNTQ
jgi:hypothetical protein